ncbi:MAG: HRDC domain-containing protein, partial [Verrucomicrobiales bacterium]
IVQMLMGSRSQEVLRVNLDKLSTYGLLKNCGTAYLNGLFRSLEAAGLVATQKGEFPLLTLTARGEKAMKGELAYRLIWPVEEEETGQNGEGVKLEEVGFDAGLYEKLRDVRTRLAKERGEAPYMVFSNKTLEFLTRLRPQSEEELTLVKGVGPHKARRYGKAFLAVLRGG